jgi:DNA-binding NarL/FixJ family response regulator
MPQEPKVIGLHRSSSAGVRILLADDFAPWRSQVRSFLQRETEWKIVFEACDGLEAVQKTVELHPDVVLLDVSMPGLNGIEAASRIRQLSPDSKIVILTQNADEDLRTAALQAGALAYVLKAEMTTELIPAVGGSANKVLGSLRILQFRKVVFKFLQWFAMHHEISAPAI